MSSNPAAEIKAALTAEQVARAYGFEPNRAGFIQCPFHSGDHSASLKLYPGNRGWHCFACHKGGTVIDFVMELFDLDFPGACERLSNDFGLGVSKFKPDKKAYSEAVAARLREQAIEDRKRKVWWSSCRLLKFYERVLVTHRPKPGDQALHPLYAEALRMVPWLRYWLENN